MSFVVVSLLLAAFGSSTIFEISVYMSMILGLKYNLYVTSLLTTLQDLQFRMFHQIPSTGNTVILPHVMTFHSHTKYSLIFSLVCEFFQHNLNLCVW